MRPLTADESLEGIPPVPCYGREVFPLLCAILRTRQTLRVAGDFSRADRLRTLCEEAEAVVIDRPIGSLVADRSCRLKVVAWSFFFRVANRYHLAVEDFAGTPQQWARETHVTDQC